MILKELHRLSRPLPRPLTILVTHSDGHMPPKRADDKTGAGHEASRVTDIGIGEPFCVREIDRPGI